MNITSHSVCAPIVDVNGGGQLLISRMTYCKRGNTTLRHMMETGKFGQTIMETLDDCALNEGAKDRSNFSKQLLSTEPIHIAFGKDQDHPNGTHLKVSFPIFIPRPMIRDYEAPDDDDPDEVHGGINLVCARDLISETRGKTIPFHFDTTMAILGWQATQDTWVGREYRDILSTTRKWRSPREFLSAEQKDAIAHYAGAW